MKKIFSIFVLATLFLGGCREAYDDTRIRQDLDDLDARIEALEKAAGELNTQYSALTELINSSFVSLISTDADGNYVVTYMDKGGERHSITLATQADVVTQPILGIAEEGGKWYWRQTTDNGASYTWLMNGTERIEAGGPAPKVGIDPEGYWTVNGKAMTDDKGNKILANDVSNILFKEVFRDEKTGEAVFVLADGTELRMQMFEALNISFNGPIYTAMPDYTTQAKIKYTIGGSQSAGAVVALFTTYNVDALLDASTQTITVSLKDGALEGNILVLAHSDGNTVLKPLFFTYGSAVIQDPVHSGSTAHIVLEGDLTQFEVQVSASIDYTVEVDQVASGWLLYNQTRAMTTLTHHFTADYYENPAGVVRTGEIRFLNALYNVSAKIMVKQSPSVPVGGGGGISTASDLMAFAAAVNAGAGTSRWQNEVGEVILLNDIDMSAITEWTPIGSVDPAKYTTTDPYAPVNPFKGTFDGKGFAIKNLKYTADMSGKKYGYGLFGSIQDATIRNLTLGDPNTVVTWTFTGLAPKYTSCASLVVYALNSTIEKCTNYYNIDFTGDNAAEEMCIASGLVAAIKNSTIGGRARSLGCANYGFVRTGVIANNNSGGNGMQTAGICGFMAKDAGCLIQYCTNYGAVSSPTGRTGGLVGTMMNGNIKNSDNYGLIQDDVVGKFAAAPGTGYDRKRMGGLVGGTDNLVSVPTATVESCINYGNVMTLIGCRTGGFIGHSNVQIIGCANEGAVLGDVVTTGHGPGWACGFTAASTATWINIRSCTMGGQVGSYATYKDNPSSTPAATVDNALSYENKRYDPSINN